MGGYLGRMLYVKDGLTDYHEDLRKNRFNPVAAVSAACRGIRGKTDRSPQARASAFLEEQCEGFIGILWKSPMKETMKHDLARGLEEMTAPVKEVEQNGNRGLAHAIAAQWFRWVPFFLLTSPDALQAANGPSRGDQPC